MRSAGFAAASALGVEALNAFSFSNILKGDTVNIGVIGTGGRGKWLIKLLQNTENARVMACCDIIPEHLEEGLALADAKTRSYKDYRKLLENKDLHAVIVSTPLSLHYPVTSRALEAGKHVYCEKTMVFTEKEALDLISQVQNSEKYFRWDTSTGIIHYIIS